MTTNHRIAHLTIGGGEIILILALLAFLAALAAGFLGLVFLIVRAAQHRPSRVPSTLPPEVELHNQQRRDREHLKLLSIFHCLFGGLALAGIGFLFVHYFMMHTLFANPEMWKYRPEDLPPKAFLDSFIWLYVFMGVVLFAGLVLNVLSGLFLWQRRHRVYSIVTAGLDCLQIPFGTALGVFTLLVLSRDSVRQLYEQKP